jgi:hypothetical protein
VWNVIGVGDARKGPDGPRPRGARWVLLVWAAWLAAIAGVLAVGAGVGLVESSERPQRFLWPLFAWDYDLYAYVAENGYRAGDTPAFAFFPLWPAVLSIGGWKLAAAVVVVASAAAFLAVSVVTQARTAVALACWPGSFALALAYPDAVAVAAAAGACVVAARASDRLLLAPTAAAVLGAVAAVARPSGFLVAIPLAWLLRGWGRLAALVPLLAAAAVHAYFWWRDGTFGAFFRAQSHWGRGEADALLVAAVVALALAFAFAFRFRHAVPAYVLLVAAVAAAAGSLQTRTEVVRLGLVTLPALALLVRARVWFVYSAVVVALSLASGSVQSLGRQTLLAFPLVWVFARAPWWLLTVGAVANAALLLLLTQFAP